MTLHPLPFEFTYILYTRMYEENFVFFLICAGPAWQVTPESKENGERVPMSYSYKVYKNYFGCPLHILVYERNIL
jgi:hypothetical protein